MDNFHAIFRMFLAFCLHLLINLLILGGIQLCTSISQGNGASKTSKFNFNVSMNLMNWIQPGEKRKSVFTLYILFDLSFIKYHYYVVD